MITTFIIIFLIVWWLSSRSDKKNARASQAMATQLPSVNIVGREMGGVERFLNLTSKSHTLHSFYYQNGQVYLQMANGAVINEWLSNLTVGFDQGINAPISCKVKDSRGNKVTFYVISNFTDSQWGSVIGTLRCAGKVSGTYVLSSLNKNIKTGMKILKHLQ